MTLATVRVAVSKELSISTAVPNQHGYIRSSPSSLGRSELPHTESAVGEFARLGVLHILSQLSAHRSAVAGHCSQVESSPHLHPISCSFLGTLGISGGAAENLVLQVLSKNGFTTGTTPVRSVSTKSWFHHRLALRLHQHQ